MKVAVIGLGYVGLPVACLCVEKGMDVYGADIDNKKLELIEKGISPIDDPYLNREVSRIKGKISLTNNAAVALFVRLILPFILLNSLLR